MDSQSINKYIVGLQNGDKEIIHSIYNDVFPTVLSYIGKNSGTYDDAQEVFQDALYQIIIRSKAGNLEIKSDFKGYLFVVCKNIWIKNAKKKKSQVRNYDLHSLSENEDILIEGAMYQERWDLFEEKITQLSQNCKELLKLYFTKVSYQEIVKRYSYASENVAFQRIFKCKKKLSDLIQTDARYKNLLS